MLVRGPRNRETLENHGLRNTGDGPLKVLVIGARLPPPHC